MTPIQQATLIGLLNTLTSAMQASFDMNDPNATVAQLGGAVSSDFASLIGTVSALIPAITEIATTTEFASVVGNAVSPAFLPIGLGSAMLGGAFSMQGLETDFATYMANKSVANSFPVIADVAGLAAGMLGVLALVAAPEAAILYSEWALLLQAIQLYSNGNLGKIMQGVGTYFGLARPGTGKDPLLVDVGAGIHTGDPSLGVTFDLANDGTKVLTSWATSATGILVLDNGTNITSGAELFGDSTSLPNGLLAQTGFQALAAMDSNGDGIIDSSDAAYGEIGVWVDSNQNGVADVGEIETLAQIGIKSISLESQPEFAHLGGGSNEIAQGIITWADGHTSTIAEVGLADQSFNSTFTTQVSVSPAAALLPFFSGSGQVRDTQQAATLSPDFAQYLQQYSAATTRAEQVSMLSTLLDKWAATSDFKGLIARNTFEADSENYQYSFEGVQQYTWQDGANDTSLQNAPTVYGQLLDASVAYTGPEWAIDSNETSTYQTWVDMVSVLEVFNGTPLTSGTAFLGNQTGNYSSQVTFVGSVIKTITGGETALIPGGIPNPDQTTSSSSTSDPENGSTNTSAGGSTTLIGGSTEPASPGESIWPPSSYLFSVSISALQMADLQIAYVDLEKSVYGGLLLQTRLSKYVDAAVPVTNADGSTSVDTSGLDSLINQNLATDPLATTVDFIELVQYGTSALNAMGYDWATKLTSLVEQSQASGQWDSVVAELEGSLNTQAISIAADGTQVVIGMTGDEFGLLLGSSTTSKLVVGSGADELVISGSGPEILDGSQGDDVTLQGVGSDVMIGGTGLTLMHAGNGPSVLDASRSASATLYGGSGDDVITGGLWSLIQTGDGNDSVSTVHGATSLILGGAGNDTFNVDSASVTTSITLGAGSDLVVIEDGSVGSTVVNLGSGSDTISFGTGNDTIVYSESAATNVVEANSNYLSVVKEGKVLQFGTGVTAEDIVITRIGDDALISAGSTGGVKVLGWFGNPPIQFQTFELSDGTVIPAASINVIQKVDSDGGSATSVTNYHNTLTTTANDVHFEVALGDVADISTSGTEDVVQLDMGSQSTVLVQAGTDSINLQFAGKTEISTNVGASAVVNVGASLDTTIDAGTGGDAIVSTDTAYEWQVAGLAIKMAAGITASDVIYVRSGDDLIVNAGGGSVDVVNWFEFDSNDSHDIDFADGTVVDMNGLGGALVQQTASPSQTLLIADAPDANVLHADSGNDTLQANANASAQMYGGSGNDVFTAGAGSKVQIHAGTGNNTVMLDGSVATAEFDAGSGNSTFAIEQNSQASGGTVQIDAGSGQNDFTLGFDAVVVEYGLNGGNEVIRKAQYSSLSSTTLQFAAGIDPSDVIATVSGSDLLLTFDSAQGSIVIKNWLTDPASRLGQMVFADGTTWLSNDVPIHVDGGTGSDTLTGVSSRNIFDGGGGNDVEISTGSADTFVYNSGYGALEINEAGTGSSGDTDLLEFGAGIDSGNITVSADNSGQHLLITDGVSGDIVQLDSNGPAMSFGIAGFQFADGTSWSEQALVLRAETLDGTTGDDTLNGTAHQDYFDGMGGNDLEIGNGGNDTFVFNEGYGQLTVKEFDPNSDSANVLKLGAGINASNLSAGIASNGEDLILTDGVSGDQITLLNMVSDSPVWGVGEVQFADGTTMTVAQLIALSHEIAGTTGSDTLNGSNSADLFDGKGGNDTEVGNGGNDTFVFNQGYGQLEINERDYDSDAANVLKLGAGITASSLTAKASADNASLVLGDGIAGDQITIDGTLSNQFAGIQQVQFADGTTLSASQLMTIETTGTAGADNLVGTSYADTFDGHGGNDLEIGNGGNDTFVFSEGYGQLTIREFDPDSGTDVLKLGAGISASNLSASIGPNGKDLILTDGVSGDQITLLSMVSDSPVWGVAQVQFADGTTMTAAKLIALSHEIAGTSGADTLNGTNNADLLDGKGGGDIVTGGGGNDTFVFNAGYGQLEISETQWFGASADLQLGAAINASSLSARGSANGNGLLLTDGMTGDQIQIDGMLDGDSYGVGEVVFADGTTLSRAQLMQMAMTGTSGSDTLYGGSAADVIDGKGGSDVEVGNGGNDTFVFNQGYGQLEINERDYDSNAANVLKLGAGITASSLTVTASADNASLVLGDGIAGDQITIDGMLSNQFAGIQQVQFADGTTLSASQLMTIETTGTAGADNLVGTSYADTFDGHGGNDLEIGNGGNDTFVFNEGYGQLTIREFDPDSGTDVLKLGASISASNLSASIGSNGKDLILTDGVSGDQITLLSMVSDSPVWGVAQVQFADGTTMDAQQLIALAHNFTGTSGADTLSGTNSADVFDGKGGADVEIGNGGADVEIGNGGNDTYTLNPGYGSLTIENGSWVNNVAAGTLAIGSAAPDQIWLKQVGNDLQIDVMGTQTEATIQGWFSQDYSQLASISAGTGSATETVDSQLNTLIQAMATYSAQNPGFDPTSASNPQVTDPTLLATMQSAWHHLS